MKQHRHAFTLIELLVVISVIAVLMGILMPALGLARAQAWRIVCGKHLRQLHLCWQMYANDNHFHSHASPCHKLGEHTCEPSRTRLQSVVC